NSAQNAAGAGAYLPPAPRSPTPPVTSAAKRSFLAADGCSSAGWTGWAGGRSSWNWMPSPTSVPWMTASSYLESNTTFRGTPMWSATSRTDQMQTEDHHDDHG